MTARAALYARYSSDLQREASIEDQFRGCREHAGREGWKVAGVRKRPTGSTASGVPSARPTARSLPGPRRRSRRSLRSSKTVRAAAPWSRACARSKRGRTS